MIVTRGELEALVEEARAGARSHEEGLFGPGSITWRIARESVVFLGAGRAALMQLAHPYVAHAVEQHSATRRDPIGRFNRTFQALYGMIFGDLDTAIAAAWRVRAVHDRVHGIIDEDAGRFARGHRYHANDRSALAWVHATLVETSVMAFEMGFGPLSEGEKDAYHRELARAAALFGIGPGALPAGWSAFQGYVARTVESDEIVVGRPAREMAGFLLAPARAALTPAMRWYEVLTAGMLPPKLREAYGLRFDARVYAASVKAIRATWSRVPARLRHRPEYTEAMARLSGKPRRDRVGRALEQVLLAAVRPREV